MRYNMVLTILFIFLIYAPCTIASPVTSIDDEVSEKTFYSYTYTNPDSVEAHQIAVYSEDGEHSQIQLNYRLTPRTTTSPDGNYSVYKKAIDATNGVGIEDFVINNTLSGTETNIKNIITMGYYAVAFSPDSRMYTAPRIIFSEDGRNGQYAIDICSVHNNTLLHREMTPFYKENTKNTPMDWDRSTVYEVYWSEDGTSIIYEVLGADIDGGRYPTYLVSRKLNLDHSELRKMNGYDEPVLNTMQEDKEIETSASSSPITGPGVLFVLAGLILARKSIRP